MEQTPPKITTPTWFDRIRMYFVIRKAKRQSLRFMQALMNIGKLPDNKVY